jgi:hydrogenase expression/formation protein HypE
MHRLPVGKLPPALLAELLQRHAPHDPRLLLGPGIGLDCTVLDFGSRLLVAKSDPITFTAEQIGWYAVHVNANDVATTGAAPRWFLATLLLPEKGADTALVRDIFAQIEQACQQVGAQLVGGHTEITSGLDRPIVCGTMLGEVEREKLITPRGARPGDVLLLTKGVPIEATSILAREFPQRLAHLPEEVLARARDYLQHPGISVVGEALSAAATGSVTAMHDPTEGGLATGLWELGQACGHGLEIDLEQVRVPEEAQAVCEALGINPLDAIASGALLLAARPKSAGRVQEAIAATGSQAARIGTVVAGEGVWVGEGASRAALPIPPRDAIARLFEEGDEKLPEA